MDDKDWLILKTVSEEKNITKAADRLYISQPALTYRLRNIEKEFDAKVISRSPNGVALTPQGEYLLAYANQMLSQFQNAKEQVKNMGSKVQGTLRLGCSSIFAHYELPQILKGFLERYPDVDISLKTGLSQVVNRMLLKEEISIAILRGDYRWDEEKFLIREEPLCLVSSQALDFPELPYKPQINYRTDSSLKPMVEDWWRKTYSRPPLVTMEVDSMDTCRQMVLHGLGWAILPEIGLGKHDEIFKRELYWQNGEPLLRRTWVMYHTSSLELSTVHAFIDYIQSSRGNC